MLNRARPEVRTYGPYNGLCGSTCTLATQRPRASVARMADTISRPDVVLNNEENSGTDLIRSGPVHLSLLSFFFCSLYLYLPHVADYALCFCTSCWLSNGPKCWIVFWITGQIADAASTVIICGYFEASWANEYENVNKLAPYGTDGRLLLTANFKVTWHRN